MLVYNVNRNLIKETHISFGDSAKIELYGLNVPPPPFSFAPYLDSIGDSISIVFNEVKYLSYTKSTENTILKRSTYEVNKVGKTEYVYRYVFTNEHYEKAIPIN